MRYVLHSLFWLATLIGFAALLPFLAVLGILLFLTQGRPILFVQERVGFRGKTFNIVKFRTMVVGADTIGDGLYGGTEGDFRATPIGGFLRKTKLDELPQLINVIKGEMAIVGPRPQVKQVWDRYSEVYSYISKVKPGLTGPVQVGGGVKLTRSQRVRVEILYVANLSFWQDMKTVFKTLSVVLWPARSKHELTEDYVEDLSPEKVKQLLLITKDDGRNGM